MRLFEYVERDRLPREEVDDGDTLATSCQKAEDAVDSDTSAASPSAGAVPEQLAEKEHCNCRQKTEPYPQDPASPPRHGPSQ